MPWQQALKTQRIARSPIGYRNDQPNTLCACTYAPPNLCHSASRGTPCQHRTRHGRTGTPSCSSRLQLSSARPSTPFSTCGGRRACTAARRHLDASHAEPSRRIRRSGRATPRAKRPADRSPTGRCRIRHDQLVNASHLKLGDRVRIITTSVDGTVIARSCKPGWALYRDQTRKNIRVFSVELESGEVRFFLERALESPGHSQ